MFLGIDIGGTFAKLALLDDAYQVLCREQVPVDTDHYACPVQDTVLLAAQAFLQSHGVQPEGIGISATGQISREGVVIGTNGSIPGWEGCDLKRLFSDAFGVPVAVLNDANAAALGEWLMGAGQGCRDMLMITLGTGVGGGIISDGKLLTGSGGLAGELGHFTLHHRGLQCTCGRRGCYERYASTSALTRLLKDMSGREMNGHEIFDGAEQGDFLLRQAIAAWTDCIADGLSGLIHLFDPEILVIGGGVSAQPRLIRALTSKTKAGLMPRYAEKLCLKAAMLGNDAGFMGAVAHLRRE